MDGDFRTGNFATGREGSSNMLLLLVSQPDSVANRRRIFDSVAPERRDGKNRAQDKFPIDNTAAGVSHFPGETFNIVRLSLKGPFDLLCSQLDSAPPRRRGRMGESSPRGDGAGCGQSARPTPAAC
jgi:hypothetical protein